MGQGGVVGECILSRGSRLGCWTEPAWRLRALAAGVWVRSRAGSGEGPTCAWWRGEGSSGICSSRGTEPTRGPHGHDLCVNFGETQIHCPK